MGGTLWQISAGDFFELLRPAAWALSTVLSACVLADSQRRRLPFYAVAAWTTGTLLFPLVILPIYLITRFKRHAQKAESNVEPARAETSLEGPSFEGLSFEEPSLDKPKRAWKILLPLLYAVLVLSIAALLFYRDYHSIDSHLARANHARLLNQPERTIREYREALRLEDDAHTHNLLALELEGAGQMKEALKELRAAAEGGEPDDSLSYRIATTLDALGQREEAAHAYQNFLKTSLCTQRLPDARCENARLRLQAK